MKKKLVALAGGFKSKLAIGAGLVLGSTAVASADATAIVSAVSDVATDAGTGVTTGVTIGAVVFGGRVVWNAIRGMA